MKNYTCLFLCFFLILPIFLDASETSDVKVSHKKDRGILTYFSFENDLFIGSDDYYTSGVFMGVGYGSASFAENYLPKALGKMLDRMPGFRYSGKSFFGISIMHRIFTPDDIGDPEIIRIDMPYSGQLVGNLTVSSQNQRHLNALTLSFGMTGPDAVAAEVQTGFHYLNEAPQPNGWRHQLDNEILTNIFYEHRYRVFFDNDENSKYDVLFSGSVGAGNITSHLNIGLGVRFGYNIPDDFYMPASLYADRLIGLMRSSFNTKDFSLYCYGFFDTTVTAHAIALDGNTFFDSNRISYHPFSSRLVLGLASEFKSFHCNFSIVSMSIPWANPKNDVLDHYVQLSFYNLF